MKYKKTCYPTLKLRQQLLVAQNHSRLINGAGLNLIRGYIPSLTYNEKKSSDTLSTDNSKSSFEDENQRAVWCPASLNINKQSPLLLNPKHSFKQISLKVIDDKEVPEDSIFIHSKLPQYNHKERCWVMNSFGRIQKASKRNFQLIMNYQQDPLILQMGKLNKGVYILDYRRPLCFVQAMAIGLATNDWKSSL